MVMSEREQLVQNIQNSIPMVSVAAQYAAEHFELKEKLKKAERPLGCLTGFISAAAVVWIFFEPVRCRCNSLCAADGIHSDRRGKKRILYSVTYSSCRDASGCAVAFIQIYCNEKKEEEIAGGNCFMFKQSGGGLE
jgi:hypothetical protein